MHESSVTEILKFVWGEEFKALRYKFYAACYGMWKESWGEKNCHYVTTVSSKFFKI
jgi:hypothetical protein